tara:strand:- start:39 stop:446 length:408 start_codon:yes stop_codon:yes gene_type:complete
VTKKDYNYIASLEKAVAEKYGKTAVQDFRHTWHEERETDYLEQLKERQARDLFSPSIKREVGNIMISCKRERSKPTRSCPVCKTYSFSMKDDLYMNRFACCHRCYIDFVDWNEEKWKDGWRPSAEQIASALGRRK